LGTVENVDSDKRLYFEQKNRFFTGDTIELMKKNGDNIFVKVLSIKDAEGNEQESAPHPKQKLIVEIDGASADIGDILRVESKE